MFFVLRLQVWKMLLLVQELRLEELEDEAGPSTLQPLLSTQTATFLK